MDDCISRQAAIDAPEAQERQRAAQKRSYTFGNDGFSLEDAYHDCKLVFDGITDDDSFQEADTGLILYYANEIIYALHEALQGKDTNVFSNDCISRQTVIDALMKRDKELRNINWRSNPWAEDECRGIDYALEIVNALPSVQPIQPHTSNALKTLDCIDKQAAIDAVYFCTNIFVGNLPVMVDKAEVYKALENVPPAQPEIVRCKDCKYAINVGTPDMMCNNSNGWVVGTDNDFGCVLAERRTDG